jgi:hypothetical protein
VPTLTGGTYRINGSLRPGGLHLEPGGGQDLEVWWGVLLESSSSNSDKDLNDEDYAGNSEMIRKQFRQ